MKNRKIVSFVFVSMLLASCSDKSPSKPSIGSTDSSKPSISSLPSNSGKESPKKDSTIVTPSNRPSSDLPSIDTTPSDILSLIREANENTNFTILDSYKNADGDDVEYETNYTEDYIYYEYSDAGYLAIESYDGDGTQLYNFTGKENTELEDAVFYKDPSSETLVPIKDTKTLNPLLDGAKNVDASSFLTNGRYYYSKDSVLIEAFAYFLGASDFVGSMEAVTFSLNEDKDSLEFAFAPNFQGSDSDTAVIDSLHGYLLDVNNTSVPELDRFHSAYQLPKTSLSDEILSSLKDEMAYSTKVVYSYQGNKEDVIKQQDEIVLTSDAKQVSRNIDGIKSEIYFYLTKDETSQNAFDNYISYDNKVKKEDTGKKFDEFVYKPRNLFEKDAFRLMEDGKTYHYFGYQGRSLIQNLTDYDTGNLKSIDLTVEEGKITKLHAVTPLRKDTYNQTMYFDVTVEFQKTGSIKPLAAYPESDSESANYALSRGLSSLGYDFGSLFYSFTATMSTKNTNNYKTTLKAFKQKQNDYEMDTILFDQESIDTAPGSYDEVHVLTGYWKKDSSTLIPFKVKDGKAVASGPSIKSDLGKILSMDVSADIFDVMDDNPISSGDHTFQARNEVKGLSSHIIGFENKDSMIDSSLTIKTGNFTSSLGYPLVFLKSIEYEFNGEDIYKGTDQILFSDVDKTACPSDIDFTTLKEWEEPKDWKKGVDESVYSQIISAFGEDTSSKIPFLYDKEMEDQWDIDVYLNAPDMNGRSCNWINLFNTAYLVSGPDKSPEYMKNYAALLKQKGFVEKQYPLASLGEGTQLYSSDLDLYCRITDNAASGIRFLKYND